MFALLLLLTSNFELEGHTLKLPEPVRFAENVPSGPALEHAFAYLEAKSYISTLRIEVHAPDQAQSEARALAVAEWLVRKGIDCKRLLPVGFGATKPVAAPGAPQNWRTEFVNAAMRGKAIGGMPLDGGGKIAGDPCQVRKP